jgi:phosphoribosylglycinamide formyltransferase-1
MHNLAIFASGSGTNAQRIIEYFSGHALISINLVLSNNPNAFVLTRAANLGIPTVVFNRSEFYNSQYINDLLVLKNTDYLILAGFLWLIPSNLLSCYNGKILNIHPALLPKHGGRGMYGARVHEAVIAAGETESGISIHLVNEKYDEGRVIFQARCAVNPEDTPETLAKKIHELEHRYYPEVIEREILCEG